MSLTPHPQSDPAWSQCRFLTCSVLPVRVACNLRCPFCFSKSSISALRDERLDWSKLDLASHYAWARSRGARRLVVTGGGEPLLRPDDVLHIIREARPYFQEIACFSNGSTLTAALSQALQDAGLDYLCFSRHATDDATCRALMGDAAPDLDAFFAAAGGLTVRATCVLLKGYVDDPHGIWEYIEKLAKYGVDQFTFKHTYVSYEHSVFRGGPEDTWAAQHQIEWDPFQGQGEVLGQLPWGPSIRKIRGFQICYYHEPTPQWELANRLCRSSNLLSNGKVYASLEDQRSLLYQLSSS